MRQKAIDAVMAIAAEPHSDPHARIKAFEVLAKRGWPEESAPGFYATEDAEGNKTWSWQPPQP
jgi:hypothetical protein